MDIHQTFAEVVFWEDGCGGAGGVRPEPARIELSTARGFIRVDASCSPPAQAAWARRMRPVAGPCNSSQRRRNGRGLPRARRGATSIGATFGIYRWA
jgi:hypothetical protein